MLCTSVVWAISVNVPSFTTHHLLSMKDIHNTCCGFLRNIVISRKCLLCMHTVNLHHNTRHSQCIAADMQPPPFPRLPNLHVHYISWELTGGWVFCEHSTWSGSRQCSLSGPRHVHTNRFGPWPWPAGERQKASGTSSHNPIRQRKGRYAKAELRLTDRRTLLADYWM